MYYFFLIWLVKLCYRKYWFMPTALIFAQAKHETGGFNSDVFKENKNFFGMKQSSRHYDKGVNRGHAVYHSLIDSIKDYFDRQIQFKIAYENTGQYINETFKSGYAEDLRYKEKWLGTYLDLPVFSRLVTYLVVPAFVTSIYWLSQKTNNFTNFKGLF